MLSSKSFFIFSIIFFNVKKSIFRRTFYLKNQKQKIKPTKNSDVYSLNKNYPSFLLFFFLMCNHYFEFLSFTTRDS